MLCGGESGCGCMKEGEEKEEETEGRWYAGKRKERNGRDRMLARLKNMLRC